MAGAYTRRFYVGVVTGPSAWIPLFSAPQGATWVVRDLIVINPGTAAILEIALRIDTLTKDGPVFLWYGKDFATGVEHLELRQTLHSGERADVYLSAGSAHLWVTGYELSP